MVLQGCFQIYSKTHHCFWDGDPDKLKTEITEGPAAGLVTDPIKAQQYNEIYADMTMYYEVPDDNLLVLSERTWTYLAADMPYGTYSAWLSGEKPNSINRLKEFYEINPDKKPVYIYVPNNSKWDMNWLLPELMSFGYTYEPKNAGYSFVKN